MIKQRHHVTMSSPHHSAPPPSLQTRVGGEVFFFLFATNRAWDMSVSRALVLFYLFIFARGKGLETMQSRLEPQVHFFNTFLHIKQLVLLLYLKPMGKPVKTHKPISRVGVWWGYKLPYPDPYPTYPTHNLWGVCEPVIFPRLIQLISLLLTCLHIMTPALV